jgi:hypothetical protein
MPHRPKPKPRPADRPAPTPENALAMLRRLRDDDPQHAMFWQGQIDALLAKTKRPPTA